MYELETDLILLKCEVMILKRSELSPLLNLPIANPHRTSRLSLEQYREELKGKVSSDLRETLFKRQLFVEDRFPSMGGILCSAPHTAT
jgi:hypothetical protein